MPLPIPSMKYELLVDPIDQEAGNAADTYRKAWAALGKGDDAIADQLFEAMQKGSSDFDAIAALCGRNGQVFDLLERAGRAETCDWESGYRQHGARTLLPHLRNMRTLGRLLALRAHGLVHQGKIEDAIATIRIGCELGRKTGLEPIPISGLVGNGIVSMMQLDLVEAMNRLESPNLYWALATLPMPIIDFRRGMEAERISLYVNVPVLFKTRSGEITVEQWADAMGQIAAFKPDGEPGDAPVPIESIKEMIKPLIPAAREYYAQTHQLSAAEVAKIDPIKVVGVYGFDRYQAYADEKWAINSLPYPRLIPALEGFDREIEQTRDGEMGDVFTVLLPSVTGVARKYVALDRQIAALTCVEAIRNYAAEHDGKLPGSLGDMTDTPAPLNPRTGEPFEYHVDGATATLADSKPDDNPLKYLIQIAK